MGALLLAGTMSKYPSGSEMQLQKVSPGSRSCGQRSCPTSGLLAPRKEQLESCGRPLLLHHQVLTGAD